MMESPSFLDLAMRAAERAGEVHKKYFNKNIKAIAKSTHFDLVTNADIESEETIVSAIREVCPEHNILAEEKKYAATDSEYTWIIDPLDGTSNYAHNIPIFSVSIALAYKREVILGVVFDPMRNEMFSAEKYNGAFLNGAAIRVSSRKTIDESIISTGFYYDRGAKMKRTLQDIETFLLKGIVGIRRLGSAALDLCNVASGRGDGYWEFMLNPWDFSAGKLIVEEAGGKVTDNAGGNVAIEPSYIVASNGTIHGELLSVLK